MPGIRLRQCSNDYKSSLGVAEISVSIVYVGEGKTPGTQLNLWLLWQGNPGMTCLVTAEFSVGLSARSIIQISNSAF